VYNDINNAENGRALPILTSRAGGLWIELVDPHFFIPPRALRLCVSFLLIAR
jgi:hypothetical protein